ncbi:6-phosphofructo-2-kinase-domain-containing protein [Jimgerdemannia flammicorona]|uniref:6-phosphofructo-2-kinase-domain-containing protein n=1 Tax=Jimgerdemannia flammicorona TaxID=994334 RepID=A0A433QEY5_9FUNG|nr:6-phosphofructo-2-kinase-domain-containing protein [Jimgerdemannia flammicorona]
MEYISSFAPQFYKTITGRLFHAQTKGVQRGNYRTRSNDFFAPGNLNTAAQRQEITEECLRDMDWLENGGGQVGIYDASNTTEERRRLLTQNHIQAVFIDKCDDVSYSLKHGESICNKSEIIEVNIRSVKMSSPDDCIDAHEPYYETITDLKLSFVKMVNVGEQIVVNNVNEYLQSRIVYYLMNLHINPCTIYFAQTTQNGESLNQRLYMADADLSEEGHRYAENLKNFLLSYREQKQAANSEEKPRQLTIWTSARKRSVQTAQHFAQEDVMVRQQSELTEINPRECDGLTLEQTKQAKFPEEYKRVQMDPYRHRYPRADVCAVSLECDGSVISF